MAKHRYFTRSPDGRVMYGFQSMQGAETAAKEYGNGACVVDTQALTYEPMVQIVKDGELVYFGVSGWNTNKLNDSENMIEGIRNGNVAIVHAYIECGADASFVDKHGGTPLHWAAARGKKDIVELLLSHGASAKTCDADGETALDVAKAKKKVEIIDLLE